MTRVNPLADSRKVYCSVCRERRVPYDRENRCMKCYKEHVRKQKLKIKEPSPLDLPQTEEEFREFIENLTGFVQE